jgi:alkanesulfonate monooxygenase SsuD/methylene tetrahydromethanopterin reductase-like flavin-dependent oxidoreductase (luciferase family)
MQPTSDQNENRRRFPEAAAFVDAVRKLWPEARVTYVGPPRVKAPATSEPRKSAS